MKFGLPLRPGKRRPHQCRPVPSHAGINVSKMAVRLAPLPFILSPLFGRSSGASTGGTDFLQPLGQIAETESIPPYRRRNRRNLQFPASFDFSICRPTLTACLRSGLHALSKGQASIDPLFGPAELAGSIRSNPDPTQLSCNPLGPLPTPSAQASNRPQAWRSRG
jgi:hypothetical protein